LIFFYLIAKMTATVVDEPPVIPGPTDAEDGLTEEERSKGMVVMDPRWGYRAIVEPSGLLLPFDFDLGACADLRERFEINSHDVIVTTYPKCGTAWMQQIVLLLMRGSEAPVNPMSDAAWIEMSASSAANGEKSSSPPMSVDDMLKLPVPGPETSNLRAWKTHSPVQHVPWKGGIERAAEVGAKLVIVSRNPKDAGISMLHHTKNIPPFGFFGNWEEFAPLFLEGKVEHSSFWDWHRDWSLTQEKFQDTILWVHFEDMKKDLKQEITRIAKFLNLDRSEEEIAKVTDRCTFTSMKKESKDRGDKKKDHFRSGKAGGWVDVMSEETVAAFDAKTSKLYSECNLRFQEKIN